MVVLNINFEWCAYVVTWTTTTHRSPVCVSTVRSGYRLQASQGQDAMKVVYYVERDVEGEFHPTKGASHSCKPVCSFSI